MKFDNPILRTIRASILSCAVLSGVVSCGGPSGERGGADDTTAWAPIYRSRYAERFELLGDTLNNGRSTLLRVRNPWQGAENTVYDYRLVSDTAATVQEGEIRYPIRSAVCMSSTHVAFLDALGEVSVVRGASGIDFIANPAVHTGAVKEVGYDTNLDYETIVALRPDVVFIYGVGDEHAAAEKLRQLGVPVVYIADYLENEPLGRAEWIVPFGLLTGKLNEAILYFNRIEARYRELATRIPASDSSAVGRPKVMLNAPYRDVWYLPGDRSYMARLVREAGGDYLGRGTDNDASRPVSAEHAWVLMQEADYWLAPGMAQNLAQLKTDNHRFAGLPVVREGRVFNNNARITPKGGSDFWESGVVRPDRVLADMIRILHPELLPEHELYYFHRLK